DGNRTGHTAYWGPKAMDEAACYRKTAGKHSAGAIGFDIPGGLTLQFAPAFLPQFRGFQIFPSVRAASRHVGSLFTFMPYGSAPCHPSKKSFWPTPGGWTPRLSLNGCRRTTSAR